MQSQFNSWQDTYLDLLPLRCINGYRGIVRTATTHKRLALHPGKDYPVSSWFLLYLQGRGRPNTLGHLALLKLLLLLLLIVLDKFLPRQSCIKILTGNQSVFEIKGEFDN